MTVETRDVACAAEFYVRRRGDLTHIFPCVLAEKHDRHRDSTGREWEGTVKMTAGSVWGCSDG